MSSHWLLQSQADFARLLTGSVAAQAIVIAAMPIVSRLYQPAAMGEFLFLYSIALIVGGVAALRLDSAVHVARDAADLAAVLWAGLTASLVLGLAAPLGYLAWLATGGGGITRSAVLAAVLGFVMAATHAVRGIGYGCALRAGRADLAARSAMTKSWTLVALQIVLGLLYPSGEALLLAEALSTAAMLATLYRPIADALAPPVSLSAKAMLETLARQRRFVLLEAPSTLLSELTGRLPILAVMAIYGADKAGLFGVAYQIVQLPNRHIGGNLGDVVQTHAGRLVREGAPEEISALLNRNARLTALAALLPLLATLALAPYAFPIVLGQSWGAAGGVAQALAPWMFAALVVPTLARVLLVIERQDVKLAFEAALLTALAALLLAAARSHIDLTTFAWALSGLHVVAYASYFIFIRRCVRRVARRQE